MKIKDGFILREVAGSNIIVGVGEESIDFNGIINVNDTGAFIWNKLCENMSVEETAKALTEEYDGIDSETAVRDIENFINKLRDAGLVEE